ncbi:TDP-N-acetylfucosamine:lipid II N-acetylfucosaminyltransferase [Vibrio owensii]|uniref:TDP-N-acetylfucosamine:lipid II N-acetylfucosaminyltransferase n=1 Tax=Vibrio owensii TaxID=696485 RepID=UPI003391E08B
MKKVLHLAENRKNAINKFVPDFQALIEEEGLDNDFIYVGDGTGLKKSKNVNIYSPRLLCCLKIIWKTFFYEKVILHSLPTSKLLLFLLPFVFLSKKFYLVLWGGEIHHKKYNKTSFLSKFGDVIRYLALRFIWGIITDIDSDYEIVQQKYKNKGIRVNLSGFYPSNIFYDIKCSNVPKDKVNVLIGASAAKRNCHERILATIRNIPVTKNMTFICPLSYGDPENAKVVDAEWKAIYGDKFQPIFEFMELSEYRRLLSDIDIALFAFDEQQALGNIRNLLGFGCKVYLNSGSIAYKELVNKGFDIYDIDEITDFSFDEDNSNNQVLVKKLYSRKNTIRKIKAFLNSNE